MINFFRKIRRKLADDKTPLKYLRYAIGEIVLVVIGILIALQINNWNEENKERQIEEQRYQNILNDIQNDEETINQMITNLRLKQDLHYYLYELSQNDGKQDSAFSIGRVNRAPELNLISGKNQLTELEFIKDLRVRREVNDYIKYENAALSDAVRLELIIKNDVRDYFKNINAAKIDNYFSPQRYDNSDIIHGNLIDMDTVSKHFNDTDFKGLLIKLRMSTSNALNTLGALKEKNKILKTFLRDKQ